MSAPDLTPRQRDVLRLIIRYGRAVHLALAWRPLGPSICDILVDARHGRAPARGPLPRPFDGHYRLRGRDCVLRFLGSILLHLPTPTDDRRTNPGFTWWHVMRFAADNKTPRREFGHLTPTLVHDFADLQRLHILRPLPGNADLLELPAFDWLGAVDR